MGAAITIFFSLLDLLPKLTKTVAAIKDELQRSGEMTPQQVAEMNAKWEAAFASPHWQKEPLL
jgi:hypothetical protein